MNKQRGYTLIELVVAVGLFALIMTLVSGAYIMTIGLMRHAQGNTIGIDNLSFALETMTRTIRTGTSYGCPTAGANCSGGVSFSVKDSDGHTQSYSRSNDGSLMQKTDNDLSVPLTDPSVAISSLTFYTFGATPGDNSQPHVTIVIAGTVSSGLGKPSQSFTVETGATMRNLDL